MKNTRTPLFLSSAQRAAHTSEGLPQYVGVDLRGAYIRMPAQRLHRADVTAATQQLGRKTVAAGRLAEPRSERMPHPIEPQVEAHPVPIALFGTKTVVVRRRHRAELLLQTGTMKVDGLVSPFTARMSGRNGFTSRHRANRHTRRIADATDWFEKRLPGNGSPVSRSYIEARVKRYAFS